LEMGGRGQTRGTGNTAMEAAPDACEIHA
jgi:hypothetical protein